MATYWHKVKKQDLSKKIEEIKENFNDCEILEAEIIVPQNGAFVKLNTKEDAEKLLLHNTIIVFSDKVEKDYENTLKNKDFAHGVFLTAESKTADIEKKLISGVHGAKECHFVVVESV